MIEVRVYEKHGPRSARDCQGALLEVREFGDRVGEARAFRLEQDMAGRIARLSILPDPKEQQ